MAKDNDDFFINEKNSAFSSLFWNLNINPLAKGRMNWEGRPMRACHSLLQLPLWFE